MFPGLTIGNKEVERAIIQGGMAVRISKAPLAAAVANAGGIGVIGAIVDDLIHGRIDDDFIQGISSSRDEVSQAFTDLIVSVIPHLHAMNTPMGWVQS